MLVHSDSSQFDSHVFLRELIPVFETHVPPLFPTAQQFHDIHFPSLALVNPAGQLGAQLGLAPALAQSASGLVCHCSSIQAVFVPAGVVVHGVHVHQLFDPHSI